MTDSFTARAARRSAWLALVIPLLSGCENGARIELFPTKKPVEPPPAPTGPATAREALAAINANLAAIRGALYGSPATVSFSFRDERGRDRRFIGHPAMLIFENPRCFVLEIRSSIGGTVARIGSNDLRYWLWVDIPDERRMWWGTWAALRAGQARKLAAPPDQLLDSLMMRPLPEKPRDGLKPILERSDGETRLVFQGLDGEGYPFNRRVFTLDPNPPHLPIAIVERDPAGNVVLSAELRDYEPVGDEEGAPLVPRRYVLNWPQDGSELRLDLGRLRYRTKTETFCDFPEWDGEVEPLDMQADDSQEYFGRADRTE